MIVVRSILLIAALSLVTTATVAGEFRDSDEPGHRGSFGDSDTPWTAELDDFLNCSLREYLNTDFVEACAIFKEDGRRFLECRYYPDTYEKYPDDETIDRRDEVSEICVRESFKESSSENPGFFTNLWSQVIGQ